MIATALGLSYALTAAAVAGPADWTVSGDTVAAVGVETTIVVRPPASAADAAPDAPASSTTDYLVLNVKRAEDGSWQWRLLPLGVGRLPFQTRWTLSGNPLTAPPVTLAVGEPPFPKDAEISDIKGPAAARRNWWPWLAAALFGAAVWEGWRRWRARPAAALAGPPPVPPESPDVAALKALDALSASGLWDRGEYPAYYLSLTDIFRRYLEGRYGDPATAMTSTEVARSLRARDLPLAMVGAARELLQRADLVKFARIVPAAEEGPRDCAFVRGLIGATTPVAVASAPEVPI